MENDRMENDQSMEHRGLCFLAGILYGTYRILPAPPKSKEPAPEGDIQVTSPGTSDASNGGS